MKTYNVIRDKKRCISCLVTVDDGGRSYFLRHCVFHSPTGFETGYSGSGPADLALSILADHCHATPPEVRNALHLRGSCAGARQAIRFHQRFKFRFIAPRPLGPGECYEILGGEIAHWLADLCPETDE